MPAMTIHETMPTTRTTKKQVKSATRGRKQHRRLLDILGENRTLKAWLRDGKGCRTEAFVILAQGLSAKDRVSGKNSSSVS